MSLSVAASTQALSAEQVFTLLERVRQKTPRVHAITNAVAQSFDRQCAACARRGSFHDHRAGGSCGLAGGLMRCW